MDVDTGVGLWNDYIAPLQGMGYNILGSPATTSAPNGLDWMKEFLPKVAVKPTHICVHWYDVGFDNFKAYVENFHAGTGYLPILITEFACQNFNGGAQCSEGDIWNFVHAAVPWMDSTAYIHGYAPFGALYLARISLVSHEYSHFFPVLRLHEGNARRERSGPAHDV